MWNYLIITASNEAQAAGYRVQLDQRLKLGLLTAVDQALVIADPDGKRVGSGGSTLFCLMQVLKNRLGGRIADALQLRSELASLRILILHAGGDSRRLPAYGPCGKIFIPVPGESDRCLPMTLFDRQLPTYLALPAPVHGGGQVVITSGDVMLRFDPKTVRFNRPGLTGLGCYASPQRAASHGVYCGVDDDGRVRRYLQKPSPAQQEAIGAPDHYGRSVLDIGVMHFDADTAIRLLELFGVSGSSSGQWLMSDKMGKAIMDYGLDFYREICCGLGRQVTWDHYRKTVVESGSIWPESLLRHLMDGLRNIDFNLQLLDHCDFIDFGTSSQIIRSGTALIQQDQPVAANPSCLQINNEFSNGGRVIGTDCWVEGCRISVPVTLEGRNVLTGVTVARPMTLAAGACLDVSSGFDPEGGEVWFIRSYGNEDTFKGNLDDGATFCGRPVRQWFSDMGATDEDLWDASLPPSQRSLWEARLFVAETRKADYHKWLWIFDPAAGTDAQRAEWKAARRYSMAQILRMTNSQAFFRRRLELRAGYIKNNLRWFFRSGSEFSALELRCILDHTEDCMGWMTALVTEAKWYHGSSRLLDNLAFSRMIHTIASVLEMDSEDDSRRLTDVLPLLAGQLGPAENDWLKTIGLHFNNGMTVSQWSCHARSLAFDTLSRTILVTGGDLPKPPVNWLRSDEIVWGRVPARFDTGGGWTDTPPYSLEYGGCVVNVAVDLNGQAPIQAYLRVTPEPVITIGSIDLGTRIRITKMEDLLDYRSPTSQYGLVKAALALSGFSPSAAAWPKNITLTGMLESFGGGIDITTLAAIPKGSGLGTSSIMGAVILAVIHKAKGQQLTSRQLFNQVLQLEQALTTGGGWQDQVGGVIGGAKIVYADADLVPDPRINYLPGDVIDPAANGGLTLLYYTGITRLAKNILEQVVGRYLDRDRRSMATLRQIQQLTGRVAEALSQKDLPEFGRLMDTAWQLNKQLDPNSTNQQVETLLSRVRPHVYGAKLLGAGGGGFLLMVCRSADDAHKVRTMLKAEPPNERGRFFDFNVNYQGLVVTVC